MAPRAAAVWLPCLWASAAAAALDLHTSRASLPATSGAEAPGTHSFLSVKSSPVVDAPSPGVAPGPWIRKKLAVIRTEVEAERIASIPFFRQGNCAFLVCFWICFTLLNAWAQGSGDRPSLRFLQSFVDIIYLYGVLTSGFWADFLENKPMSIWCQILCWMVFGQLLLFACLCGCCCCGLGAFVVGQTVIKNLSIKEMHKQYEERKKNLSGPRRDYYDGELFQRKCDRLFDEFDEDGNGSLDMSELKPLIQREIGEDIGDFHCAIIRSAFDENGDSTVEKAEFKHMMQFISMIKFKEGNFSEDTAFEVLQVDPKTGTHADVKKSYRKLSLKYHPDKRTDVPDEERRRDMAEINDAKRLLDKKFGVGGSSNTESQ